MLRFLLLATVALSGCATNLKQGSTRLSPGDSKDRVIEILGSPDDRQFKGAQEAWQYCSTGAFSDEYLVVWLYNGAVAGMQSYNQHGIGSCTGSFKTVRWEEAPTISVEVRDR